MLIARSIAQALALVLIERVDSIAARASAPTWSTPGRPCRKRRSAESDEVIWDTSGRPVPLATGGEAVVVTARVYAGATSVPTGASQHQAATQLGRGRATT